ncbi:uncharacterized protein [Aristolochia californica]|uniref:uncharacterized protein isoform X2 n=1 Tax=Aristolochia californica TaxID=171875 RepID=UPI0035DA91DD
MEAEGQRTLSNPSTTLTSLLSKREKLQEELRNIEKQVYDLETSYLHDSSQSGNVLKGFEGFLSSSKSTTNLKRSRKFQPEDRLFSLSSITSPAAEEHIVGRDGANRRREEQHQEMEGELDLQVSMILMMKMILT